MKQSKTRIWFPLFALFVIFSDELFYGFVSLSGMGLESGMKSREAIVIAGIAYLLLIKDMLNHKLSNRNYIQLFALLILLVLYYVVQYLYSGGAKPDRYFSSLLVNGALCIPAGYVGMRLARCYYNEHVLKYLPFFVIAVSSIVAAAVFKSAVTGVLLNDEDDVFNYQSASYYLSYCFSYSFFYVFLYKDKRDKGFSRLEKYGMTVMLFVCALGCILGGGRGAFVYLVCVSTFVVYRLLKQKGKAKGTTIVLLMIAAGVMVILAQYFQVFESSGFTRVSGRLTKDDARTQLWFLAMNAFQESPIIGHGLGSIWWEVGFYSHNMLSDFLVETGIVGAVFFVTVLIKIFVCLSKRSKVSSFDMFIFLVFLGALVKYTFSGYWFSAPKLFLAFGYVFGMSKQMRVLSKKDIKIFSN